MKKARILSLLLAYSLLFHTAGIEVLASTVSEPAFSEQAVEVMDNVSGEEAVDRETSELVQPVEGEETDKGSLEEVRNPEQPSESEGEEPSDEADVPEQPEGEEGEKKDSSEETGVPEQPVGEEEDKKVPAEGSEVEEPDTDNDFSDESSSEPEDSVSDNSISENSVSEEKVEDEDNWEGSGHKAPQLEMSLTSAMVSEKYDLVGTADRLKKLEKNVQYVANEAVFLASSQKYAETVAEGYGAALDSYEDGVAVIVFADEVTDIIAMAEDEKVKLPAVYPNYIYTTCNDIVVYSDATPIENSNSTMVSYSDPFLNSSNQGYQYYHEQIHSISAWDYNSTAGKGIKVAVIDSGIQKNHEDLKGRVASAAVTYSTPYNKAEDNDGHGTHVSGIIAANINNGMGGAGIAYNATIASFKALEENPAAGTANGSTAGIIKALNAATKGGAKVINMSLGGKYYDALFEATVDTAVNKGIVVVVAAGNDGVELSKVKPTGENPTNYYSPACFDNVITVSAKAEAGDSLTDFSNFGVGIIDITAPGEKIASSIPNDYVYMNGTSQAAPMVAAAAAYIFSVSPDLKNNKTRSAVDTVKRILQDSATKDGYSDSSRFGAGLLNVEAAVKMAAPSSEMSGGTGELTAPKIEIGGNSVTNNTAIQDTDTIELSATVGGAVNDELKIYYTLDGKVPTEKSTLYTGGFSINASGNKTIKAVAVYYGKKSSVTTVKVKVNAKMRTFSIASKTNSNYLGAGKSMNLITVAGSIEPSYATNKKVKWEIFDYGNGAASGDCATINATNGKLTAASNITSETIIKVRATALDGGGAIAEISITLSPAAVSLTLTGPTVTGKAGYLLTYAESPDTVQMEVAVNPANAAAGISYTSSNVKVASVSDTGLITSVGNGTATITAKTTDGSNKKVTLKVKVTKKVQSIQISSKTGEPQVASGKTLQMVADVTSDATNKRVKWSISEGDAATINATSGKLTAKQATAVSTVKVKAEALDESGKFDEMTITVYPSVTGKISFEEGTTCNLGTINQGELKTTLQLHPFTEMYAATFFGREKGSGDKDLNNFTYTSANTKIATVSETGLITVNAQGKTGTAKIKVVARDGSGKNAVYTVKVVKPVTSIAVYSKTGSVVVGKGKKLALGAAVGGNASNKKLKWTSSDSKVATVDAKGNVKGISYDSVDLESKVVITAEATDGSGVKARYNVWVQPAITNLMYPYRTADGKTGLSNSVVDTTILANAPQETIYKNPSAWMDYFLKDQTPYYFDEFSGNNNPRTIVVEGQTYAYWSWDSVSCTCSNSNVIQIVTVEIAQGQYSQFWIPVNKGTATLTFKALDGSGKSAKLKITVM